MFYSCFVCLFVFFPFHAALNIGDSCLYEMRGVIPNVAGTCQPITKCPVAMKIVYVDEKKPQMCRWMDDVRIVCCPLSPGVIERTGAGARFYEHFIDGINRSEDVACWYDGFQHLCCPNKLDKPPPPEPDDCPPLDKPSPPRGLTPAERIAWDKCSEYQRYVKPCVARGGDSDRLIRVNACDIPRHKYRISGGQPALKNEFPHMVVLGVVENPDEATDADVEWIGGGALISDRFILTAAHVLIDPARRTLRYALLGTLDKQDVRNGLLYTITRKILHPLHEYGNQKYDIALLMTDRRVALSRFVRPICLPVSAHINHASERDIAGWGKMPDQEGTSRYLYTTNVRIQEQNSECETKFERHNFHFNSSTMICAKGRISNGKTTDSCRGDSGGPLMALPRNLHCSYTAEGVVSFGPNCGTGEAGVYTRVSHYLPWIVRTVWRDDWDKAVAGDNVMRSV